MDESILNLYEACLGAVLRLKTETEWIIKAGYPERFLVSRYEQMVHFEKAIEQFEIEQNLKPPTLEKG